MRQFTRYAMLALLFALASCTDKDEDRGGGGGSSPQIPTQPGSGSTPRTHPTTGQSWTLLVYMVADNNLEPDAIGDLTEMMAVGSAPNVNIIVQVDRAERHYTGGVGGLPDWTDTKRLRVNQGSLELLRNLGEVNMGTSQTLSDFIQWGVKAYPADRYALIFWDHGSAWPGFGGDDSTQEQDLLSLAELQTGIRNGMQAAQLGQFALIGYDACLMATYEVALAMRPFGEYLLASEELEPGHGWDYRRLQVLRQNPATSPQALGEQLLNGFKAQAQERGTGANITLSLTDLYALDDLEKAVSALAAALPANNSTLATAYGRGRAATLEFGQGPHPSQSTHMVDLGDLVDQIAAHTSAVSQARSAIRAALTKAVLVRANGPQTQRSSGLSIYFPTSRAYYKSAEYGTLSEVTTWREFLQRILTPNASHLPPTFTSELAEAALSSQGLVLRGALTVGSAERITSARLYYGYTIDQGLVVLGERPATVYSSFVEASWNLSAMLLSQESSSAYVYLSLEAREDGSVIALMPFAYFNTPLSSAQYALRVLILSSSGAMIQDSFYVQSEGGFSELNLVQGSELYPLVQFIDNAGNASFVIISTSTGRFDPAKPISSRLERLPSGTQSFGVLTIEDYLGQGDSAYNAVRVP